MQKQKPNTTELRNNNTQSLDEEDERVRSILESIQGPNRNNNGGDETKILDPTIKTMPTDSCVEKQPES